MHHSQRLKQGLWTVRGVRGRLEGARLDQHSTTAVADLHNLSRNQLAMEAWPDPTPVRPDPATRAAENRTRAAAWASRLEAEASAAQVRDRSQDR